MIWYQILFPHLAKPAAWVLHHPCRWMFSTWKGQLYGHHPWYWQIFGYRHLDINKKHKKIHFELGVDFDILRWNFFRNFLHLEVWWIAGAPQFFGSQFYTYDLWRLGWEIDVWCGLEMFDHLCIVIIFVILAPLRRKGMEDMKMMFWMGFPLFRCSNLKPLNIRDSSLEVWALTWTPIVQGCPGTLMALIMESGMEKHQGQQHLQAMVFLTKVRSPFIFRFFSCWVQRTLLGWPLLSFEFVSSVLSYFWEGVFP